MTEESPALYVVPTPLGNLSDMTPRGIEVLRQVGWIACEDTRHSAPLLRHFGIEARLLAAHEHNEESAAQQIVSRLNAGESVALISDAGTPAVSDPGARIAARVREAGYRIVPLPGPSDHDVWRVTVEAVEKTNNNFKIASDDWVNQWTRNGNLPLAQVATAFTS